MHLDDKEIIYTIRAYENSAEVPEEDQVTFFDSNRKAHLIPGDDKAKDFIDYAEKCLDYLRFGDEVDEATCGALPQLLENPVLLADSPSRKDVLMAVLCAVDNDSLPLLTAIKPDGNGIYQLQTIETNFILSVYGKDEFELFFKQRITPDKIVFYDAEKGQKLERLAGIQFPGYCP